MRAKVTIFSLIAINMFFASALYSITGTEALDRFRSRMQNVGKMTGIISWSGDSGQTNTAHFKYMNPGKIYMKFSSPRGKVLVSNGKKLWVYSPSSNICGIQDLGRNNSGGISGLTRGYMAIVTSQGPKGYTLKLKSRERRFSQIILMLDRSFFLKKATLKFKNGSSINFSLSNINTDAGVMKSLFDFNVPANAQVVHNPLNIR